MAREFAKEFYKSPSWVKCREGFISYKKGLCERCLENGIIKPGDTVHHKIHLTPQNIYDPDITLSWDNLMLLCRDCHAEVHSKGKRYTVDKDGHIMSKNDPPVSAKK